MAGSKQIAGLLRDARQVAVILHRQPDGDVIGSAVALAAAIGPKKVRFFAYHRYRRFLLTLSEKLRLNLNSRLVLVFM